MSTPVLVSLILVLYAVIMVVISRAARKRNKNFRDKISASGQTTLVMLVGSAVGGQIGSGFVVGGAEHGATYGIGGAWYGIACGLSYVVIGQVLSRFVRRNHYISLSDYFTQRYEGKAPRLISSVATICGCLAALASQLLAGRSIFLTVGIPANWGVILTAAISLVYANAAGLWGAMAVSSIQSVVIFTGMLTALVAMLANPEAMALVQALPADYFQLQPYEPEAFAALVFPTMLAPLVYQGIFQSIASAWDEKTATRGFTLAGLLLIPIALIPPVLGMFGRALFPELGTAEVFMELLLTHLPTAVAAVILAAIVCSVVCACNSSYISVATNFVHDIYQGMIDPSADEKTCKRLMMAANLVICTVGVLLALRMNDIIQLLAMGYSLLTAGCLVPFMGGRLWKKGTAKGALSAAFVGMGACLTSNLGLIYLPYSSVTSVLLSLAAFIVGSLLTQPKKEPV